MTPPNKSKAMKIFVTLALLSISLSSLAISPKNNNLVVTSGNTVANETEIAEGVKRLTDFGYQTEVVETLRKYRLDILVESAQMPDASLKPMTLYRGIGASPSQYYSRFLETHHVNENWRCMSVSLNEALQWGGTDFDKNYGKVVGILPADSDERVILQFQYPSSYVFAAVAWQGGEEYRADTNKFPDDRIFLTRIGIYDRRNISQIKWYSPNEALRDDGKLNPKIYEPLKQ